MRSPIIAAILSSILPGAGQLYAGKIKRAVTIFLAIASGLVTIIWYNHPGWYIVLGLLWLWNVWDAAKLHDQAPTIIAVFCWLILAYGIGWQATEIDVSSLWENPERAAGVMEPMLRPDFLTERAETLQGWVKFEVPCSANPPKPDVTMNGVHVYMTPDCANINETVTIYGEGFWPNYPITFEWHDSISALTDRWEGVTDDQGNISFTIVLPSRALINAADPTLPSLHRPELNQKRLTGGLRVSDNGTRVIKGIYETLALAFLATVLGAIFALPISFLAAKNLMGANPVTRVIYYFVRTILNIFRSIEALILAIVFVVIVGLGPFPGLLAITIHTIAALGKLYSEVIEGIDTGPIEAIRATGANWVQIVRYAVIPQIVPPFTALTIYRWDINVRSSTIIGFVGGGGIGFYLYQWILMGNYRSVSTSFIAIALVVITLDFFSARLRERIK